MTSDLAWSVGMMSGWLALVVFLVYPEQKHCTCCSKRGKEKK